MFQDKFKEAWTLGENGEVRFKAETTVEKVKENHNLAFSGSPETLAHLMFVYNTDRLTDENGRPTAPHYGVEGGRTAEEFLNTVLWKRLKPEGNNVSMTYDRTGQIGNLVNVMARVSWFLNDFSPRYSNRELEEKGYKDQFFEYVDLAVTLIGELGSSWVTDILGDLNKFFDSELEDKLDMFGKIIIADAMLTPSVGLVNDLRGDQPAYTRGSESQIMRNIMKSGLYGLIGSDRLEVTRDFFGQPIAKDVYDWTSGGIVVTSKLAKKDYVAGWKEELFETMQFAERQFPSDGLVEGLNLRDYQVVNTGEEGVEGGGSVYTAYEAFQDNLMTMRRESEFPNEDGLFPHRTLEEEISRWMQTDEFKTYKKIVTDTAQMSNEEYFEVAEDGTSHHDRVNVAREKMSRYLTNKRGKYIDAFRTGILDPTGEGVETQGDFMWVREFKSKEGATFDKDALELVGPSGSRTIAAARVKWEAQRNEGGSALELLE